MGYKSFDQLADEVKSAGFSSSNPWEAKMMTIHNSDPNSGGPAQNPMLSHDEKIKLGLADEENKSSWIDRLSSAPALAGLGLSTGLVGLTLPKLLSRFGSYIWNEWSKPPTDFTSRPHIGLRYRSSMRPTSIDYKNSAGNKEESSTPKPVSTDKDSSHIATDETTVSSSTDEENEQSPKKVYDQLTGQYVPYEDFIKLHGLDSSSTSASVPVNNPSQVTANIPVQVQKKKPAPKHVVSAGEPPSNSQQVIPHYEPLPPLQTKVFTPSTEEIFSGMTFNGQPVTISTWSPKGELTPLQTKTFAPTDEEIWRGATFNGQPVTISTWSPKGELTPLQTKTFAPTDEEIWRGATFNGQPVSVPIRKNEAVNNTPQGDPTLEELVAKWKREGDADYDAAYKQYEADTWNDIINGFGEASVTSDSNGETSEPSIEDILAKQEEEYNRRYSRMGLTTSERLKNLRYAPIVGSLFEMFNKSNLADAEPYIKQYQRTLDASKVSTDPMMPLVRYDRYDPTFEAARQKSSETQALRSISQGYGNRPGLSAGAISNLFMKGNEAAGELYRKGQLYNRDIANIEEQANRARMQDWLQRHNANQQFNAQFAYQTGNMINDVMQGTDNMNRQTKFNARQMFYKNLGLLGQDEMNRWNAGVTALNGFESAGGGLSGYYPNAQNNYPAIYGDEQNKQQRPTE